MKQTDWSSASNILYRLLEHTTSYEVASKAIWSYTTAYHNNSNNSSMMTPTPTTATLATLQVEVQPSDPPSTDYYIILAKKFPK